MKSELPSGKSVYKNMTTSASIGPLNRIKTWTFKHAEQLNLMKTVLRQRI